MASNVADHFIREQIEKIRYAVEAASFQDRAILNGKRGFREIPQENPSTL